MNYNYKKEELLQKKEELLIEFKKFFVKSTTLTNQMATIFDDIDRNSNLSYGLYDHITNDEEMKKIMRLFVALQYVENPSEEVIEALKENIEKNNSSEFKNTR